MTEIDLTKTIFSNNRAILRKEIIEIFLNEKPGTGKGNLATRYKYIISRLQDGRYVYLSRPANFNNGFDFTLNVSSTNFNIGIVNKKGGNKRASTRPTHDNILTDLKNKKEKNPQLFKLFIDQIDLIFNCKNPTNIKFDFQVGHPSELLIECIKWLFIEQDVTYWNYSGRKMFYNGIKGI